MKQKRKIIVFIAMSLDGFIADKSGNLDFLKIVENENEDYGYFELINSIDTVIIGRKTYDKILSFNIPFPHATKDVYVISHTTRPSFDKIHFYTGSLSKLVETLTSKEGKDIFVDGGGEIFRNMINLDLVDKLIISIIPIMLGEGIFLFKPELNLKNIKLISMKSYSNGLVQLHYSIG